MLTDREILMIQNATIYDLQCILKAESKATYTVEELKKLIDLYIKTLES